MTVMDTLSLRGKTAVVTGGAGLFGRQIAEALAEAGAVTFMASRDQAKLEAQAVTFRERGLDVTALPLDQGQESSVDELLKTVLAKTGRVDVLVNNAVLRPMKGGLDGATADFARSMEVNATGIFVMCRTFGRHMAERGGGSIINVGSIQGMIGPDLTLYEGINAGPPPDYFFHKGGMIQLSKFMASHLGKNSVRVNTISPGGFLDGTQNPRQVQRYSDRTFLGRMADETDLKGVIVFLASDASRYVTGTNIPVDGGYTAK